MKIVLILMVAVLSLIPDSATARICLNQLQASNSASRFQLHGDEGTATDRKTGLMWQRCLHGQTWNSQNLTCDGNYMESNFQEALMLAADNRLAGYHDWRLPNIRELESILNFQCSFPMIDPTIFKFAAFTSFPTKILSSTLKNNNTIQYFSVNTTGVAGDSYLTNRYVFLLVRDTR